MLCGFSSFFYILLLFFSMPVLGIGLVLGGPVIGTGWVFGWLAGSVEWDRVKRSRSRAGWIDEG